MEQVFADIVEHSEARLSPMERGVSLQRVRRALLLSEEAHAGLVQLCALLQAPTNKSCSGSDVLHTLEKRRLVALKDALNPLAVQPLARWTTAQEAEDEQTSKCCVYCSSIGRASSCSLSSDVSLLALLAPSARARLPRSFVAAVLSARVKRALRKGDTVHSILLRALLDTGGGAEASSWLTQISGEEAQEVVRACFHLNDGDDADENDLDDNDSYLLVDSRPQFVDVSDTVWPASCALSERLLRLREAAELRVLELGAGTGLCGLAAATRRGGAKCVVMTDCAESGLALLRGNVALNKLQHKCEVKHLDWTKDNHDDNVFDLVLVADCWYFQILHLAQAQASLVARVLGRSENAFALVAAAERCDGAVQKFAEAYKEHKMHLERLEVPPVDLAKDYFVFHSPDVQIVAYRVTLKK